MNIGVIGTGYVGLVQGVILSEFGLNVTCMDIVKEKIDKLKKGIIPIYEPGLKEFMDKNVKEGRLKFTTDIEKLTKENEVLFIAVGTPAKENGSADLQYIEKVSQEIAQNINGYKIIVNKSTVPVGTGKKVKNIINKILEKRNVHYEFDIVSNPEFLREGKAINDCLRPDRVVIGTESTKAIDIMKKVYDVLYINQTPFVFTNLETAEMIKYASNAFLAVKISFINELALLAEKVGANIQQISRAMGMDGRISPKFLHAGPGYGGSCFPKDTRAIVDIAKQNNEELKVVNAAIEANQKQKEKITDKIINALSENKDLKDKNIAILGLTFKPDTDDMRESPAIDIINGLVKYGAKIQAYCPKGIPEAKWRLQNVDYAIKYMNDEYEAVKDADALVIITEWNQFRGMNLEKIKINMKGKYFFDLRNIFSKNNEIKNMFIYMGIGIN